MFASLLGSFKTAKLLLERGADTTISEKDGYTPIHGAGYQGDQWSEFEGHLVGPEEAVAPTLHP